MSRRAMAGQSGGPAWCPLSLGTCGASGRALPRRSLRQSTPDRSDQRVRLPSPDVPPALRSWSVSRAPGVLRYTGSTGNTQELATSVRAAAVHGERGALAEVELGGLLAHLAVVGHLLRPRPRDHPHLLGGEVAVAAGVLAHAEQRGQYRPRAPEAQVGPQVLDVEQSVLEPWPPGGGEPARRVEAVADEDDPDRQRPAVDHQ